MSRQAKVGNQSIRTNILMLIFFYLHKYTQLDINLRQSAKIVVYKQVHLTTHSKLSTKRGKNMHFILRNRYKSNVLLKGHTVLHRCIIHATYFFNSDVLIQIVAT